MTATEADDSHALLLRIDLLGIQPAVYRKVIVPALITLPKLHQVMQAAMGWTDSHLHEFGISGVRYGTPDPFDAKPPQSERRVRLSQALGQGKVFSYLYDFGDGWEHRIEVKDTLPIDTASKYPFCTGGAQACPPEDVGGPPGYMDFLHAVLDRSHPEHAALREWYGGEFDPSAFNVEVASRRLRRVKL